MAATIANGTFSAIERAIAIASSSKLGDKAGEGGFGDLVERIDPPLLKHVTNPLTNERGYRGKDMPAISWEVVDGANYVDIICQPKALGSGRWAALEIFSYPSLEQIERYVMEVVLRAGSQHCPPVIIGVGIGGDFDVAAKLAKQSTLRKIGSVNPESILAGMEQRLLAAVNATGFGAMGTGGDTPALAVHCDYASGHGYTPVAVAFNCWINRRTAARLHDDGRDLEQGNDSASPAHCLCPWRATAAASACRVQPLPSGQLQR